MRFFKRLLLAVGFVFLYYPVLVVYIPLSEFADLTPAVYYLVATALLALLLPFWFAFVPIQIGLLIIGYRSYFPAELAGLAWLTREFSHLAASIEQFVKGGATVFPTNVSLLFMLLLMALSGYLLIVHLRPGSSILAVMIYMMILQVFTTYDYFPIMVQIMGVGIFLFGIARIPESTGLKQFFLSFMIVMSTSFGLARTAIWMTNTFVPQRNWVENQAKEVNRSLEEAGLFDFVDYYTTGGGVARMGYDEDDSVMGGPVQQNFDPVFAAYDDHPHYWRISTRSIYTGIGWENPDSYRLIPIENELVIPTLDDEISDITIIRESGFQYFPYTYNMVDATITGERFDYVMPGNELYIENRGETESYSVSVINDMGDISRLQGVSLDSLAGLEEFLMVPESVPQRVWDLTQDVTAGAETMYEKVRALEQYLSSDGGFRYSLREAAVLPEGWDYVDHFLFETRVGYCDNFSTAMVVMARMAGIPARFAKGFNSGTEAVAEDGSSYYEVTNANAHSWPEIYFPGHGWIPFEPTPAFNQPLTGEEQESVEVLPETEDDVVVVPEEEDVASSESTFSDTPETNTSETSTETEQVIEQQYWPEIIGVLLFAMIIAVYRWRRKLYGVLAQLLLQIYGFDKQRVVLWLFERELPRQKSQTLRQYFTGIEQVVPMHRNTIARFVTASEATLYGPIDEKMVDDRIYHDMITVYHDIQVAKEKSSF